MHRKKCSNTEKKKVEKKKFLPLVLIETNFPRIFERGQFLRVELTESSTPEYGLR